MTAIAATIAAGSAFAHPVNEPHVCGIDPDMVMDWPASNWVSEDGTIYDKGDYFFVATNDLVAGMSEYTTTHTRIWKDDCRVTGVDIFHADDDAAGGSSVITFSLVEGEVIAMYGDQTINFGTPNPGNPQTPAELVEIGNTGSQNGSVVSLLNVNTGQPVGTADFSDQDQAWEDLNDLLEDITEQL